MLLKKGNWLNVFVFVLGYILSFILSATLVYWGDSFSFYFTESLTQFKSYYPRYYLPIFITTRIVKFGAPILAILLVFKLKFPIHNWLKSFNSFDSIKQFTIYACIAFGTNLFVFIILYFLLPDNSSHFYNQLILSKTFLIIMLIYLGISLFYNGEIIKQFIRSKLSKESLPYNLSIFRILFFSYALFMYLIKFPERSVSFEGLIKQPLPNISWLIEVWPVSDSLYFWMCIFGAFCSLMIIFGFKTRLFLILNSFIIFYVVATPNFFGKLWHIQIIIWISWILAASPCFDVFSIDSLLAKRNVRKSASYNIPLKAIFLLFGIIYFFAGFHKIWLSGFDWALSESMLNQMYLEWFENYNEIPKIRIDKVPILLHLGGIAVIIFELSFIFLIANQKTRWIAILGALIMHSSIAYFMHISFFMYLQIFYVVFIPWDILLQKLNFLPDQNTSSKPDFSINRAWFIIPFTILFANTIHGVLNLSSYPFSAYPSYHDLIPSTIQCLQFKAIDSEQRPIDLWGIARENSFSYESFSRFEPEIANKYLTEGIVDTMGIDQLWRRWELGIPSLKEVEEIEVYVVELYLNPARQQDTILKNYLYTVEKGMNDSQD